MLAVAASVWLALRWDDIVWYDRVCWLSLISLFLHQFEAYRIVGTFPGMRSGRVVRGDLPDHAPHTMNTSLIINVAIGWSFSGAAIAAGTYAIWPGIATPRVHLPVPSPTCSH
ncbi:MAG: hypothetical protein QF733_09765 [Phycisphaerales bacterium]|nr:hypothetical protein [Phycisphaerales bacterium]